MPREKRHPRKPLSTGNMKRTLRNCCTDTNIAVQVIHIRSIKFPWCFAGRALFTLNALKPLFALLTLKTLRTLFTLWALVALRAG